MYDLDMIMPFGILIMLIRSFKKQAQKYHFRTRVSLIATQSLWML